MDITGKKGMLHPGALQDIAKIQQLQQKSEQMQTQSARASTSPAEAEKAATDFEALLLHQMIKSMWNTVPEGAMLSGSREEQLFRDMLNEQLAQHMAENQGLGIKDVILEEMRKREDV